MATLGKLNLAQPEDFDGGMKRLDVLSDALTALQQRGIVMSGPPLNHYKGEMPMQITSLDDEQLGDLLNNLSRWCAYISEELEKGRADMTAAQAQLEFTEGSVRRTLRADEDSKKMTVQDKNDIVTTDPRVVTARARALYTDAVYTMTKTILNAAQRDWETVSRRITQRGQDIERMKRENNVAGIPTNTSRTFRRP